MKKFSPDKNALMSTKAIVSAAGILLILLARVYIPLNIVVVIIAVAVLTVVIFLNAIYLPLYFDSLVYESSDTQITKHSGVIFKSQKAVRYSTVQYSAMITTPFSAKTGLNFAVLFVYGGQLRLAFLSCEDCSEILRLSGSAAKGAADVS